MYQTTQIPERVPYDELIIESLKNDIPALLKYMGEHNIKYNVPYLEWKYRDAKFIKHK